MSAISDGPASSTTNTVDSACLSGAGELDDCSDLSSLTAGLSLALEVDACSCWSLSLSWNFHDEEAVGRLPFELLDRLGLRPGSTSYIIAGKSSALDRRTSGPSLMLVLWYRWAAGEAARDPLRVLGSRLDSISAFALRAAAMMRSRLAERCLSDREFWELVLSSCLSGG